MMTEIWDKIAWAYSSEAPGLLAAYAYSATAGFFVIGFLLCIGMSDYREDRSDYHASVVWGLTKGLLLAPIWPLALLGLGIYFLARYSKETLRGIAMVVSWPVKALMRQGQLIRQARRQYRNEHAS